MAKEKFRILVFTAGNRYRASSKYRAFLLGEYITKNNTDIEWDIAGPSTHDISQLSLLSQWRVALTQARTLFFGGYDLVFAQRSLYNKYIFVFLMINNILRLKPMVFDIDDAVFMHSPFKTRWLSKTAAACFGGSTFVCDYMRKYNKNVYHIPTLIEFSDYDQAPALRPDSSIPTIGWLGNGVAHAQALRQFAPALKGLREAGIDFKFLLIGGMSETNAFREFFGFIPAEDLEIIEYVKAETDIQLVPYFARMHIGVMPLIEDDWSRGKCALKALQYMASGAATVVSPVGENTVVIENGKTGMLADSREAWQAALQSLVTDASRRMEMGTAGRFHVEEHYSYESQVPGIVEILRKITDKYT